MIDITLKADYKEVDRALGSLIRAMSPKAVNSLAARTAWKQVKIKYPQRFASQVDNSSLWQTVKRMVAGVGTGLPLGAAPGYFTGTTYNSIVVEATEAIGKVYPRGKWPQGSGKAMLEGMSAEEYGYSQSLSDDDVMAATKRGGRGFKWCDGSDWGVEAHLGGSWPIYIKSFPDMTLMKYGEKTAAGNIEWLYLDNQDVDIIVSNLEKYFNYVLERDHQGIKSVFDSTTFRGEMARGEEFISPEQEVADESAEQILSRTVKGGFEDPKLNEMLQNAMKEWEEKLKGEF